MKNPVIDLNDPEVRDLVVSVRDLVDALGHRVFARYRPNRLVAVPKLKPNGTLFVEMLAHGGSDALLKLRSEKPKFCAMQSLIASMLPSTSVQLGVCLDCAAGRPCRVWDCIREAGWLKLATHRKLSEAAQSHYVDCLLEYYPTDESVFVFTLHADPEESGDERFLEQLTSHLEGKASQLRIVGRWCPLCTDKSSGCERSLTA